MVSSDDARSNDYLSIYAWMTYYPQHFHLLQTLISKPPQRQNPMPLQLKICPSLIDFYSLGNLDNSTTLAL